MLESYLNTLRDRESGRTPLPSTFRSKISNEATFIERLELQRNLCKHKGCVNTVCFNETGNILVSGSDDRDIVFWDWQTGAAKLKYASGHRNNVFQARILPNSSNKTVVTCARDGQVRLAFIPDTGGNIETKRIASHVGAVHKLALDLESPFSFFSCGEDSEVKHFDLREPGYGVKKLLNCRTPNALSRIPRCVPLYAIHINPTRPWQFVVSGQDEYARIYDQRFIHPPVTRLARSSYANIAEPVSLLAPSHLRAHTNYRQVHITCIKFSQQGEVLATYNDEDIYLFSQESYLTAGSNMARPALASPAKGKQHAKPKRSRSDPDTISPANRQIPGQPGPSAQDTGMEERPQQFRRLRDASDAAFKPWGSQAGTAEGAGPDTDTAAPSTSCQADPPHVGDAATTNAEGDADHADTLYGRSSPAGAPREVAGGPREDHMEHGGVEGQALEENGASGSKGRVLRVPQSTREEGRAIGTAAEGSSSGGGSEGRFVENCAARDDVQQPTSQSQRPASPGVQRLPPCRPVPVCPSCGGPNQPPSAGSRDSDDAMPDLMSDDSDSEFEGPLQRRLQELQAGNRLSSETDIPQLVSDSDTTGNTHDSSDDEDDMGDGNSPDYVIQRYSGHRNHDTVKGVSFFGENDEYVVSGSDCGHLYIWAKGSAHLHAWLHGDDRVVNCLEPHPHLPFTLATSGIDDDIKIWEPTAGEAHPPHPACREMMERNRRRENALEPLVLPPQMLVQLLRLHRSAAGRRPRQLSSDESSEGHMGGSSDDDDDDTDMERGDERCYIS